MRYFFSVARKYQDVFLIIGSVVLIIAVGRALLPSDPTMFLAHDETQAARVSEFRFNLKNWVIPPRIAPHASFGMGYPLFTYYAQSPYWIASFISFLGFDILESLKLSFLLALILALITMYLFMRLHVSRIPALISAILYVISPYVAVEIFVRGNLGEIWGFALLPLGLYALHRNSKRFFPCAVIILFLLFTSHTLFSLIAFVIVNTYLLFVANRKLNITTVFIAVLLGAYFFIPLVFELGLVQTTTIATQTVFKDHFLCLKQIWSSPWGYAGSAKGCTEDGMSFMIGKTLILTGIAGMIRICIAEIIHLIHPDSSSLGKWIFKIQIYRFNLNTKLRPVTLFFFLLTVTSLFFVLPISQPVWNLCKPVLALFQFPWRFLLLAIFGFAYFSGIFCDGFTSKIRSLVVLVILVLTLYINMKFFAGNTIASLEFKNRYLSDAYISTAMAYKVPEYIPNSVNYRVWKKYEGQPGNIASISQEILIDRGTKKTIKNTPFFKQAFITGARTVVINVHAAPYWNLELDGINYKVEDTDELGRPVIHLNTDQSRKTHLVSISYHETPVERVADYITFIVGVSLLFLSIKSLQKRSFQQTGRV